MGMYHSTYFAYGMHIPFDGYPWEEGERADTVLAGIKEQCPDVGHLCAGDYDRDMYFLVTECTEVNLGEFKHVTPQAADTEQLAIWNRQLAAAAEALGYAVSAEPGWLTVPDVS
jgi:hypothetical protein